MAIFLVFERRLGLPDLAANKICQFVCANDEFTTLYLRRIEGGMGNV